MPRWPRKSARSSQRTKQALAAAKARGVRLGNPRLAEARAVGNKAMAEEAERQAALVLPHILPLDEQGMSLRAIARELAARGVHSARRQMARGSGRRHPAPMRRRHGCQLNPCSAAARSPDPTFVRPFPAAGRRAELAGIARRFGSAKRQRSPVAPSVAVLAQIVVVTHQPMARAEKHAAELGADLAAERERADKAIAAFASWADRLDAPSRPSARAPGGAGFERYGNATACVTEAGRMRDGSATVERDRSGTCSGV
jgi:hypothetical protein